MTTEDRQERSLDELLRINYSDMTDDEIDRVVEWKSGIKARDTAYQQQIANQNEWNERHLAELQKQTEIARREQQALLRVSEERLRKVMGSE